MDSHDNQREVAAEDWVEELAYEDEEDIEEVFVRHQKMD